MINDVYKGIKAECKVIIPNVTVYRDNIPQNFKTPSFFTELLDLSPERSINGKQRISAQFDLQYFPDGDSTEYKTKCIKMQEELYRHFHVLEGSFHVKDRSFKVTDDVLHFQFTVDYAEAFIVDGTPMQELETNTNLKED